MKKILFLLLLVSVSFELFSQFNSGRYQGFKVLKNNKEAVPNLIDIHIENTSSTKPSQFLDSKGRALNGYYHIILNPNKYAVANISKGVLNGEWVEYFYNSLVEKGTFKNGILDGDYVKSYNGEEVLTFKNGILQRRVVHYANGQLKEELVFIDGELHGKVIEYLEDGTILKEGEYAKGLRNGRFVESNSSGFTSVKNYKNDKLCGSYIEKYPNGQIWHQGAYDEKGEKTGRWATYEESGDLREEAQYLNGKFDGERRTYSEGKLRSMVEYKDGKYNGKNIWYYTSNPNQIHEEKNYTNHILDGLSKFYREDGVLGSEVTYENGNRVYMKDYGLSGNLYSESTIRDNQIIRNKIYAKNGKLKVLQLVNENGELVDVQTYDTSTGKITKTNKTYHKPKTITLKEDPSGIIDIE